MDGALLSSHRDPAVKREPAGSGSGAGAGPSVARGLFDPNEWNPLRSFVVAAGVIGLISFCFSTNLLLYRFSSQPSLVVEITTKTPGENAEQPLDDEARKEQSRADMTTKAQMVADIDQRQRAMQIQGMEKGLGILAGTALIFFGGILLSLLFTEIPSEDDSASNSARSASPGAALMLAGALLIGWSTSKEVEKLPSFTSSPSFKFLAEP